MISLSRQTSMESQSASISQMPPPSDYRAPPTTRSTPPTSRPPPPTSRPPPSSTCPPPPTSGPPPPAEAGPAGECGSLLGAAGPEVKQQLAFTIRGSDRREVSGHSGVTCVAYRELCKPQWMCGLQRDTAPRGDATLPVRTRRAWTLVEFVLFSIVSHV